MYKNNMNLKLKINKGKQKPPQLEVAFTKGRLFIFDFTLPLKPVLI